MPRQRCCNYKFSICAFADPIFAPQQIIRNAANLPAFSRQAKS
jgi:hypothetical protein